MTSAYDVKHIQIRAIKDDVIVSDMDFGEIKTSSGIILRSDDGKAHGVKPRWGKVYKIGPNQEDVKEGQWILIEHGRWTRSVKIKVDNGEEIEIRRVENKSIMLISDHKPSDVYLGESNCSTEQSYDFSTPMF